VADPAECAELRIATRLHLQNEGFDFVHAFAIFIRRADGECVNMVSEELENVVAMVAELTPPTLGLCVGPGEDHAAILAAIRGERCAPGGGRLH
jgi:hypothetical protein